MEMKGKPVFAVMNIHYMYYPLEYFLDAMAGFGIRHIDLWAGHPHLIIDQASPSGLRQLRRVLADKRMNVVCLTPEQIWYPVNIAAKEPEIRKRGIDYLLRAVDAAAELGAGLLQVVPGWGYFNEPPEEAWKRSCEALRSIADKAGEAGVTVVLEALQPIETNLVTGLGSLKRMLDDVGSAHLKAVIDTCHMEAAGEDLDGYFKALGDRIAHIHFNETGQLPWGSGSAPMQLYMDQLRQWGYDGFLTLEICSRPHFMNPDAAVRQSLRALGELDA